MGARFSTHFKDVAVTAAQDLFQLSTDADTSGYTLIACIVTQSSDAGDSESEQLKFLIKRVGGTVTDGTGGTTPTIQCLSTPRATSGLTVAANNTTRASGTSDADLLPIDEHVQAGLHYVPTPEMQYDFLPNEACVIGLEGAPADSLTMSGYVIWEEH